MIKMNRWAAWVAVSLAAVAAVAQAEPSATKKDLIQRMLTAMQPEIDGLAQQITSRPASQLAAGAQQILVTGVPQDKREATARQVEVALKKYMDESIPLVKDAAAKEAPGALTPTLDEKFTEEELRQLVVFMESPVRKKWLLAFPEVMSALNDKTIERAKSQVDPKAQAAEQAITKVFEAAIGRPLTGAAAPASGAAPAKKKK